MQYLQQSITNKEAFCECERERASHFRSPADGSIRPISELSTFIANSRVVRLSDSSSNELPKPLPMPVMNFGDDDEQVDNSQHLPMPKLDFEKKEKDEDNRNDFLPLPTL